MKTKFFSMLLLGLFSIVGLAQEHPHVRLSNGLLEAKVFLPDSENGFYKGSRFDWAGVIPELKFKGHSFFGKWYTWPKDTLKQNVIMGPVEGFGPLGYSESKVGENFVKIGIGTLEKENDEDYDFTHPYKISGHGNWTISHRSNQIKFNQELTEGPYPYSYTKSIEFSEDVPTMQIRHTLKNTGKKMIRTNVFNHNYFVIDDKPVDSGYKIKFPFEIVANDKRLRGFAKMENNEIRFLRGLGEDEHAFIRSLKGFDATEVRDFDITYESANAGVGVKITSDVPLSDVRIWAATKTACPEPYVDIKVAPGQSFSWALTYSFYTL